LKLLKFAPGAKVSGVWLISYRAPNTMQRSFDWFDAPLNVLPDE